MSFRIPAALAFSLVIAQPLSSQPALAQAAPDAEHRHMGGGFFRTLSAEQRLMLFLDLRKQTTGMTDDQRRSFRRDQREKFLAMSDDERKQFADRLQAEWDALPPDEKTKAKDELKEWRGRMGEQRAHDQP